MKHLPDEWYLLGILLVNFALASAVGRLVPYFRNALVVEQRARLTPLDGLRGILCFAVLAYHAKILQSSGQGSPSVLPSSHVFMAFGQTSVALFFCITAFLFWSRVSQSRPISNPWAFLRGRLFRIAPLYLASIVIALPMLILAVNWRDFHTYPDLLKLLSLGVYTSHNFALLDMGVTWTLHYEWGFYLFFAISAPFVGQLTGFRALIGGIGAYLLLGLGPSLFFISGVAAAYAIRIPAFIVFTQSIGAGLAAVILLAGLLWLPTDKFGWQAFIMTTSLFTLVAGGVSFLGILVMRGLRLMGLVSYSVYLLHGIVLTTILPWLSRYRSDSDSSRYWLFVLGLSIVVFILSLGTYRWIEKPCMDFERGLSRARSPEKLILTGGTL